MDIKGVAVGRNTMTVSSCLRFSFPCKLRAYHEYRSVWTPRIGKELTAKHESNNNFNRYTITVFKTLPGTIRPSVVGHLPRKIYLLPDYPRWVSIMQSHQHSPLTITTSSRWSRNSYTSDGYYGAGKE